VTRWKRPCTATVSIGWFSTQEIAAVAQAMSARALKV
jgi:hypothetical protein